MYYEVRTLNSEGRDVRALLPTPNKLEVFITLNGMSIDLSRVTVTEWSDHPESENATVKSRMVATDWLNQGKRLTTVYEDELFGQAQASMEAAQ